MARGEFVGHERQAEEGDALDRHRSLDGMALVVELEMAEV